VVEGGDIAGIETTVMRRVAWRILPFLMLCYFVSFLDRVNAGFAALQMNQDLNLTPAVFGLGGGLFFVGYFLFEVPSNLALERVGARIWIARIMISWGVIAGAMAAVKGAHSFYAARFLLGLAEAGFFPGVMLYVTYWFPAAYRARIIGWFTIAIPVSAFLGSPLSAALLGFDGALGLRGWQWMFILEAVPAILLGVACWFVLSDRPADAAWLKAEERAWLTARLEREHAEARAVHHASLWRVLADSRVLALALVLAGSTAASSGLQLWAPQIIKEFGLGIFTTGLLTALPFALAAIAMVLWGRRSDRKAERIWHTALPLFLEALALLATLAIGGLVPTLILLCLAMIGIYAGKGPVWAVATETLSRGTIAAGLAQISALSSLSGFGAVYVIGLIKSATGSYPLALTPLAALALAAALATFWLGRVEVRRRLG
jgi:MFS transporter, ACS family, tartrate transporter